MTTDWIDDGWLAEFTADITVETDGPSLWIAKRGFRERMMMVTATPDHVGPYRHLRRLGITCWPYEVNGVMVDPGVNTSDLIDQALEEAYEDLTDDYTLSPDAGVEIQKTVRRLVAASHAARTWAKAVDFEALHAFDCVYPGNECANAYGMIVGPDVGSRALRRFVLDYPIMAGLACDSPLLAVAAATSPSVETGYAQIIAYVQARGFPGGRHVPSVGPVPKALLQRIRGLEYRTRAAGLRESLRLSAKFLDRARGMPAEAFPATADEFLHVVWTMRSEEAGD